MGLSLPDLLVYLYFAEASFCEKPDSLEVFHMLSRAGRFYISLFRMQWKVEL